MYHDDTIFVLLLITDANIEHYSVIPPRNTEKFYVFLVKIYYMTVKERLIMFIKSLGIGQGAFEKAVGLSNGYVNNIRKSIQPDKIQKIALCYPTLNTGWLLTGEGEMLKGQTYYGGEDFEEPTYVPLLPISAQGGSLNDFVVSVKDSDCERVISPIRGADFAMTVAGDSMAPEYPSGSQILIKKINERAFIDWGKVYVLDTCNGSVIKRIFPADDKDPGKVKCVSINPDYPPFEVSFADIYGIYRVLLSMSIK